MTLDTLVILSGAFVAVLPFLGFPNSWDTVLLFLAGVFVVALGIVLRRQSRREPQTPRNPSTFTENIPQKMGET